MKLARGALSRALDRPDPNIRFYLFHGQDEGQSRSHAQRLLASLAAARHSIAPSAIKGDPAILADEAGAMSLFGGPRLIWIEPAGEEIADGVAALLEAPAAESPVVAIGGGLRKGSTLLKLAEASPAAVSYASYLPEGQDAERMVIEVGRTFGLKIAPAVAARIGAASGNDQAIVRQELEKLALYLDASVEAPKDLDHEALDAVGADLPEGSFNHLVDLALTGSVRELSNELAQMFATGGDAIPIIRALQRRLLQLAPLSARVQRGENPTAVMASVDKSLFFKDKPVVSQLLRRWDAAAVATLFVRCGALERDILLGPVPPAESLAEELIAVARVAQRRPA